MPSKWDGGLTGCRPIFSMKPEVMMQYATPKIFLAAIEFLNE